MRRGRLTYQAKTKFLLKAGGLLGALGLNITESQQESIENAQAVAERRRVREKHYNKTHRAERTAKHMVYYFKKHKKILAQRRVWYKKNSAKIVAYNREYAKRNANRVKEYMAMYRAEHREQMLAYGRKSYKKHREQINARARERYILRRDEINARARERRANETPEEREIRLAKFRAWRQARKEKLTVSRAP